MTRFVYIYEFVKEKKEKEEEKIGRESLSRDFFVNLDYTF